jgi:hypothetical protein
MSTMAAPTPASRGRRPQDVTWRDAVTPRSRASRRRWTVCYLLLLVVLAATVADRSIFPNRLLPLTVIVPPFVVFGMLRRGTRRIAALDHPDLDERDIAARNSAYRIAFPLLVLVVAATLVLLALSAPEGIRTVRVTRFGPVHDHALFVTPLALLGAGAWIALWAAFLPTGVLAWREPDALEPEETGGGALREPLRDAVLGLALAGGIAIGIADNSDAGLLPIVAALALLGGLARRAAGQPVMSRQRQWRVAIGIVLILIVVGLAFVVGGGSEGGGGGPGPTQTR